MATEVVDGGTVFTGIVSEIATVFEERPKPGEREENFDGTDVPSGTADVEAGPFLFNITPENENGTAAITRKRRCVLDMALMTAANCKNSAVKQDR